MAEWLSNVWVNMFHQLNTRPSHWLDYVIEASIVFCCYCLLHLFSTLMLKGLLGRAYYKTLSFEKQCLAAEKICSSINSWLVGGMAYYIVFVLRAYEEDVVKPFPPLLDHMLTWFLGYSMYDIMTMIWIGDHWTMWLHHVIGVFGACGMLMYRQGSFWTAIFGITELTAFFHNAVWYLQKVGIDPKDAVKTHRKQLMAIRKSGYTPSIEQSKPPLLHGLVPPTTRLLPLLVLLRLVSFFVFRIWIGPYSLYHGLKLHEWSVYQLGMTIWEMPLACRFGIPFVAGIMTLLNFAWTVQVILVSVPILLKRKDTIKQD